MANDEKAPFISSRPPTPTTEITDEKDKYSITELAPPPGIASSISRRLYVSHFLSTWNSRVFEFGSVLYLAAIFPGTLLQISVYAVARSSSVILLSSAIGQYIDAGNRLQVVRLSIVLQRISVAASCIFFFALAYGWISSEAGRIGALTCLTLLACIEKLAAVMNLVAIERDWVVVLSHKDQDTLRRTNAQMRRIDLICKMLGPFLMAIINDISTKIAIWSNFGMNVIFVGVEYLFIAQIYDLVPELHERGRKEHSSDHSLEKKPLRRLVRVRERIARIVEKTVRDMKLYFNHRACIPSFACALLYMTVLSFAGQMVTYLLSTGYNSTQVAIARTLSVGFEILATWTGPWLMAKQGPVIAGLLFVCWQCCWLLAGIAVFWVFQEMGLISASGLVIGTVFSRLGLWGFDLCTQTIIQEEVEEDKRGSFSTTEQAWQNLFELCAYVSTMIFSSPSQFLYPASMSVWAVQSAWLLYCGFVMHRQSVHKVAK